MTILCDICGGELEQDRLRVGPLKRVCLDCLSDDERHALEHDLETAAVIQSRLLPERNFTFGDWQIHYSYEPLGTVSGDHIDLIRPGRNGQALHFLFGDVSGKGVAASILMANLQALFRSLVSQELPLAEIVSRGNALFHESTAASSYATLVAGRLGIDGRLEVVNAGHNPPFLVRCDEVCPLVAKAMPLGLARDSSYEVECLDLDANDFLFLYTDGLSEALNEVGEEFGTDRLGRALDSLRQLDAREIVDRVLIGVRDFRKGTPRVDDVTAMAIRRRH